MTIDLTFTLSTGSEFVQRTSDFATLGECKERLAALVMQESSVLTFDAPGEAAIVMPARHIVAVKIAPAGDR